MIEKTYPKILYELNDREWEFEEYDISYEMICKFISRLKGFKHDFHLRTTSELEFDVTQSIESLGPLTMKKLFQVIKLHAAARKHCKKELGRLRRIIRKVICLSPELQGTMVIGQNLLTVPTVILINISVFEKFVSWFNKCRQHEVIIERLGKLIDTFEPVIEPQNTYLPTPIITVKDVVDGEYNNIFQRDGRIWILRYKGKEPFPMKDSVGMRYISQLLKSPHHPFHPTQLASSIDSEIVAQSMTEEISTKGPREKDLKPDRRTLADYKKGLEILREKLAEAESIEEKEELGEKIKHVRDLITKQRFNDVDPQDNKASNAVRNAIKRTINEIQRHDAELGEHLSKSIDTGLNTLYRPSKETSWLV